MSYYIIDDDEDGNEITNETNETDGRQAATHQTVRMALPAGGEVTVTGERAAVLATVASVHGCAVDVRRNPQSDDGRPWLVVDAAQAEQYPAYLAEVRDAMWPGHRGHTIAAYREAQELQS